MSSPASDGTSFSDSGSSGTSTPSRRRVIAPLTALGTDNATERGGFVAAQMLGVALCRYILRQEPLASLPVAQVVATVAPSVQRYLTMTLASQ